MDRTGRSAAAARGLNHLQVLRRRHAAPGRHHSVRAAQLVGQGFEAVLLQLGRLVGDRLLRVEDRRVVELGEGIDEELPVAVDLGAELVDLGLLPERVARETTRELAEVLA
jgi:hypothetical protein